MKNTLILIITALVTLLTSGCEILFPEPEPKHDPRHDPVYQSGHNVKKGGPPAHAPAHGYRRKFGYTYYPSKKVYHSKEKGTWFWIENGDWKFGAKLPSSINLTGAASEKLELEADTPYDHFKSKSSSQGKGRGKGKGKGKGKYK